MRIITSLLFFFACQIAFGQMSRIFSELPNLPFDKDNLEAQLTEKEKLDLLGYFKEGDSVQFKDPYYEYDSTEEQGYLPFNMSGLRFIDLDMDGDLDILYSGLSGSMGAMDSKIYILNEGLYEFKHFLSGKVIQLSKNPDGIEISTYWKPCCDSYTSRFESYLLTQSGELIQGIGLSMVGIPKDNLQADSVQMDDGEWVMPLPSPIRRMKDFSGYHKVQIQSDYLYTFKEDFRFLSPYFGKRNQEIKGLLMENLPIPMMKLEKKIEARIIAEKVFNNDTYSLIITDVIETETTLFERWSNQKRRFLAWVKQEIE